MMAHAVLMQATVAAVFQCCMCVLFELPVPVPKGSFVKLLEFCCEALTADCVLTFAAAAAVLLYAASRWLAKHKVAMEEEARIMKNVSCVWQCLGAAQQLARLQTAQTAQHPCNCKHNCHHGLNHSMQLASASRALFSNPLLPLCCPFRGVDLMTCCAVPCCAVLCAAAGPWLEGWREQLSNRPLDPTTSTHRH